MQLSVVDAEEVREAVGYRIMSAAARFHLNPRF